MFISRITSEDDGATFDVTFTTKHHQLVFLPGLDEETLQKLVNVGAHNLGHLPEDAECWVWDAAERCDGPS